MNRQTLVATIPQAFVKLDPRHLFRSPVIFVVWVGSLCTTVLSVLHPSVFAISITVWLWITVLFANYAEAVAEGRGKAQAATLRKARKETLARRLLADGSTETVAGSELRIGDHVTTTIEVEGVPVGTEGRVLLANGFNWQRYRILFDNGAEVGDLDGRQLAPIGKAAKRLKKAEKKAAQA